MSAENVDTPLAAGASDGYPVRPTGRQLARKLVVRACRRGLGIVIFAAVSIWAGARRLRRWNTHVVPLRSCLPPARILIIRLDLIGDLVLSLVLLRVLKHTYPQAELDLICVPASAQVVRGDPDITHLLGYDPNIWRRPQALVRRENWRELQTLLSTLRGREYDLAISVFGKWAAVLATLSGARRTLGFASEGFAGLLTDSVPGGHWRSGERRHEVDYCLELAQAAGAVVQATDRQPVLYVQEQARQEAEQILQMQAIHPGSPLIACHVSANNGQSKRWPVAYWAILLDRLIREEHASIVLTGAGGDRPLVEQITARMHERAVNLVGQTSLAGLAALLKRADLLISGDSGPMHIAGAVGTPLVAIHGPTDPALSGPVGQHAVVLRSAIWCSPCYRARDTADCRFFTTQCMKDITPAQVLGVVRRQLQESAARAAGSPRRPGVQ
ncbi:MAG TPA: lipopolysaccharide heptosyltransferase II [Ktedonobacteraceae bacterium]|jgi:lipopolysaccharide heptosyltransferase II